MSIQPQEEVLATMRHWWKIIVTDLFLCTSLIRGSNQQSKHRYLIFGGKCPFCPFWLCGSCFMNTCIDWGVVEWVATTVTRDEINWNYLQFTIKDFPFTNHQLTAEFKNSYLRQIYQRTCLGQETDSRYSNIIPEFSHIHIYFCDKMCLGKLLILSCILDSQGWKDVQMNKHFSGIQLKCQGLCFV